MSSQGFRVVLSADRTQFADYRTLLDGMVSAGQTSSTPLALVETLLAPPVPSSGVRAVRAPLGLRRVEAALLASGFSRDDVAVVTPEKLDRAVGSDTRIVGLSSGDPLGLAMNTSTMTGIAGGRSWTEVLFQRLAARVRRLRDVFPDVRLVVGGPGAWQLARDERARRRLGVDHVLTGYFETHGPGIFRRIAAGKPSPPVFHCRWSPSDRIPPIRGATVMGVVEISRGCGLGCDFCTIARVPMVHLAPEAVLADVRTNLAAGVRDISLMSEDFFRYGGHGALVRRSFSEGGKRTDPPALLGLLRELRSLRELRVLQPVHANVSSVAGFTEAELREVHQLLAGDASLLQDPRAGDRATAARQSPLAAPAQLSPTYLSRGAPPPRSVWVNVGVETASSRLLRSAGSLAKMHPVASSDPAGRATMEEPDWGEVSLREVRRLSGAGFTPMISLILGLPGETASDLEATLRWVQELRGQRVVVFPVFLASIDPGVRSFSISDMTARHWRLFEECYRFNFQWNLRMLWEDETQAELGFGRRLMFQFVGRLYVLWWKTLFALRS